MNKSGFDALMHVACFDWGFCGCTKGDQQLHVTRLIPPYGPVSADQFVEWLLLADNLNPNLAEYDRHKAALREAFVTHMGSEIVDASSLRWNDIEDDPVGPDVKFRGFIPD